MGSSIDRTSPIICDVVAEVLGDDLDRTEPAHAIGVRTGACGAGSIDPSGVHGILLRLTNIVVVYSNVTAVNMYPCLLCFDDTVATDFDFAGAARDHDPFTT